MQIVTGEDEAMAIFCFDFEVLNKKYKGIKLKSFTCIQSPESILQIYWTGFRVMVTIAKQVA